MPEHLQDLDYFALTSLRTVKVGDIQKALEGIDPMVRLVDVPAIHQLLANDPDGRSEEKRAGAVALARMAAILQCLGLTFSQEADQRDLLMAELFEQESSRTMRVARIMDRSLPDLMEQVEGSRLELLEQAISHAAACGMFGQAQELQALDVALKNRAENEIAAWRQTFRERRLRSASASIGPTWVDGRTRAGREAARTSR
jgi:hypothetical protein